MKAVLPLVGDRSVPVHVMLSPKRARNLTPELVARIRSGVVPQQNADGPNLPFVSGPLFAEAMVQGVVLTAESVEPPEESAPSPR
jgi:hypothetical protein